jgi:hypothetical protein
VPVFIANYINDSLENKFDFFGRKSILCVFVSKRQVVCR